MGYKGHYPNELDMKPIHLVPSSLQKILKLLDIISNSGSKAEDWSLWSVTRSIMPEDRSIPIDIGDQLRDQFRSPIFNTRVPDTIKLDLSVLSCTWKFLVVLYYSHFRKVDGSVDRWVFEIIDFVQIST